MIPEEWKVCSEGAFKNKIQPLSSEVLIVYVQRKFEKRGNHLLLSIDEQELYLKLLIAVFCIIFLLFCRPIVVFFLNSFIMGIIAQ